MLSREENEKLTQTGPGTPGGGLMRAYWQPAALVAELNEARPVKPVRLLGEDLVLFRKGDGSYGLIGRWCAHRGVDLAYGRLEECGMRCLYHGWLYDAEGRCVEQPAEPAHSRFHTKIRHVSYPVQERNGIVFAYLGGGDPPPFPDYDCFVAPDAYTFAFKGLWECNWLQGVEGGIDPSHVSFLHRFLDEDPRETYGQQFAELVEGTDKTLSALVGENFRPDIEVETTDHGLRVFAVRDLGEQIRHVRITNLMFPNAFVVPFGNTKVFAQWHVPIDDHTHYWYMILYDFEQQTDKETLWNQRISEVTLPDFRPVRNRANEWGFDVAEQQTLTYTGMGLDINVHDQWAVESMGPIQDRTVERLGVSDRAVTANRRMLLRAIEDHEAGQPTPGRATDAASARALTGPLAFDTIARADAWQEGWRAGEARRREQSPWAGSETRAGV
ncbi:aromatic ring-hydroxylating dioxygenase subunit alpha [Conexibacter sp. JD483]|uniref:aromatic ring-hydroxylating dioxygenase subunit alpha n=1 Tax=unclassified Conexibacter TaxID=2627773 RepID=UPI00271A7E94|nr:MULTISPECIES: aromatic ring-hydroxylating dioxygenase subunit alpha [unclassified Conexibacter]MDO8187844.1 aromatic ring-hydroxylating dioxygenase subunit alpha [Conexibacter sp. CPCC 205706]MDO8201196.1 aromatic ring-hydroxylating dioxygenase subunit alpha [Conexibacter sp. CPCC 205762]MDR9369792.1 aromatic ring-hydroxylating dioxygenase subunit alpha [Conexibacter sp. JD483]